MRAEESWRERVCSHSLGLQTAEQPRREEVGNSLFLGRTWGRWSAEGHRDGINPCGGPWKEDKAQRGSPEGLVFQQRKELGGQREKQGPGNQSRDCIKHRLQESSTWGLDLGSGSGKQQQIERSRPNCLIQGPWTRTLSRGSEEVSLSAPGNGHTSPV